MKKSPSYSPYEFMEFMGTVFTWFPAGIEDKEKHIQLKKLEDSSLTLIGLGSIGSYVLHSLVQVGTGKIRVIDSKKVGQKDIEQGFYSKDDVGKSRCTVMQDRFHLVTKQTRFEWFSSNILNMTEDSILEDSDLVMLCSETVSSVQYDYLNKMCFKNKKNWLSLRFSEDSVEIGPIIIPHQTACYKCYELRLKSTQEVKFMIKESMEAMEEERYPNLQLFEPILARIVGGYASLEAIKMLTGLEKPTTVGNVLSIGFKDYTNTIHKIWKVPNCPVCDVK